MLVTDVGDSLWWWQAQYVDGRFQIEARKKEIKSSKMADGKVKKSLERDGIKPLRIEIPAEFQPGYYGLTETAFSKE